MDRPSGYEPDCGGSNPSGEAICPGDGMVDMPGLDPGSLRVRVRISFGVPLLEYIKI